MDAALLETWFARCNVPDIQRFTADMQKLYTLLLEANAVTNLTRITSEEGYWIKHVIDSLLIAEAFPQGFAADTQWLDLGCGGGFPSLVLAAAFPQIALTAVDSIGKKTRFVDSAGKALGLDNLTVIQGRGIELSAKSEFRQRFTHLTARAVAEPSRIIHEAGRMLKKGGYAVLYQTPEQAASESVTKFIAADKRFQWRISQETELPLASGSRVFLIGKKLSND